VSERRQVVLQLKTEKPEVVVRPKSDFGLLGCWWMLVWLKRTIELLAKHQWLAITDLMMNKNNPYPEQLNVGLKQID
jgi:hypothetical protein